MIIPGGRRAPGLFRDAAVKKRSDDIILKHNTILEGKSSEVLSDAQRLYEAAFSGDSAQLKRVIEGIPKIRVEETINIRLHSSRTALFYAAAENHSECVQLLLNAKATQNDAEYFDGMEPVQYYCERYDTHARTPLFVAAEAGHVESLRLLALHGAEINKGDSEGCTAAYLTTMSPFKASGRSYRIPGCTACLDILIDDYHAVFLSKHAAMLTEREKHIRAALFAVVGAALGGSFYAYLVKGNNLSRSCDKFYGDMLLQPYLFDFVTVFVFKVVQFLFEEVFVPSLSFVSFAAKWHCSEAGSPAAADKGGPSDSEIKASREGRRASQRVTLANAYEDRTAYPLSPLARCSTR